MGHARCHVGASVRVHLPNRRALSTTPLPIVDEAGPWWRIHRSSHGALHFGRAATYRFDDPAGGFGVLYAGDSPECAFIETFGHATGTRVVTMSELSTRSLSEIHPARLGADNRLRSGGGYKVAQAWSAALHHHPDLPDGLVYLACHDPSVRSVALFDRAASDCAGVLGAPPQAALVGRILDHYEFGLI